MPKTINLQPFCFPSGSGSRYSIDKPWVKGGIRYATDGRVCVAIPATGQPDSDGKFPNASEIMEMFRRDGAFLPWPRELSLDDARIESGGIDVDGEEFERLFIKQKIGTLYIDALYSKKISQLPSVRYIAGEKAVYFQFDGGEGVLMPLS